MKILADDKICSVCNIELRNIYTNENDIHLIVAGMLERMSKKAQEERILFTSERERELCQFMKEHAESGHGCTVYVCKKNSSRIY